MMENNFRLILFLTLVFFFNCTTKKEWSPPDNLPNNTEGNYEIPTAFSLLEKGSLPLENIINLENNSHSLQLNREEMAKGGKGWCRVLDNSDCYGVSPRVNVDAQLYISFYKKLSSPSFLWYLVEYKIRKKPYYPDSTEVYAFKLKFFHEDPYLKNNYNGNLYLKNDTEYNMDTFVDYYHFLLNHLDGISCKEYETSENYIEVKEGKRNEQKSFDTAWRFYYDAYEGHNQREEEACVDYLDLNVSSNLPFRCYSEDKFHPDVGEETMDNLNLQNFNEQKDWAIYCQLW